MEKLPQQICNISSFSVIPIHLLRKTAVMGNKIHLHVQF